MTALAVPARSISIATGRWYKGLVMSFLDHKIPPPFVMLSVAALMWAGHWWLGERISYSPLLYIGIALCAVAFALAFSALGNFRRARTTPSPIAIHLAEKLVISGPYRFSRNPMYFSLVVLLIGITAILGDAWLLVGPAILALFIQRFQILPEERVMLEKFGANYQTYCLRVRRWI